MVEVKTLKRLVKRRDDIMKDRAEGMSYRKIAEKYESSVNSIKRHLKIWGE